MALNSPCILTVFEESLIMKDKRVVLVNGSKARMTVCVCLAECLSFLLLRLPDKASLDHPAEVDPEFNTSTYKSQGCEGQKGGRLKEERVGSQPTQ